MIDLKSLNPSQIAAVQYDGGPCMVVAGAGSGKTRVLTQKIAYLIEKGYEPSSILALTFTNKAANEMKSRIEELVGTQASQIWAGTFHSIFARILRVECKSINYSPNFSVYDTEDSSSLVANVIQGLNINSETLSAGYCRRRISYLKNLLQFPEEYKKIAPKSSEEEKFIKIYEQYQFKIKDNDAMDFDDLIIKPLELFENKKILQKYKKRFAYILVDEFQDTNKAQYELIKLLTPKDAKICVVGDDAQSIYSWRGADLTNMLNFDKDFPKNKTFRLEQNYRSTKNILGAAGSVIKNNLEQIEKTLWTENPEGEVVSLIKCVDEKDEAMQISQCIQYEIAQNKRDHKDFSVLYRTNIQSRALEEIFRYTGLPYVIIGGVEFYRRKEVKDILAYLRVLVNQKDEESLLRIMNFPQRGIGMTTIRRMVSFARRHEITLFDTMTRVFEVIEIKERIQKNVKIFKILLDKYVLLKTRLSLSELTRALVDELEIVRILKEDKDFESVNQLDNVQELLASISQFHLENPAASLEDFLEKVALITDHEYIEDTKNVVSLMTVHSSKGLEFPVVFISGLEEDVFPLSNRFSQEANEPEERRLFYVALTRAEEKVYLSHARSRYRFGEVAYQERSRFINEIDKPFIAEYSSGNNRKTRITRKDRIKEEFTHIQYSPMDELLSKLRTGTRIQHDKFGIGKIIQLVGSGDNQKVTVVFEGNNTKQLMLKFAKLKVLHQ